MTDINDTLRSTTSSTPLRRPEPLPAKIDEWTRHLKRVRTLNDYVEDVHRVLWDANEDYRNYLEAVYDEDAVEGSLSVDDVFAAMMIRDKAKTLEGSPVADKNISTIKRSLNIVLRRYHADRKRRKNTVGGEYVPPEHNDVNGD